MRLYSLPKTPESLRFIRVVRKWLTRTPLMVCVLIILSATLIAQRQDETRSWRYFFGGVGGTFGDCNDEGFYHLGGGGEGLIAGGFGLAAELGYLGLFDINDGIGILSP